MSNNNDIHIFPKGKPIFVIQSETMRYRNAVASLEETDDELYDGKGHIATIPELMYIYNNDNLFMSALGSDDINPYDLDRGQFISETIEYLYEGFRDKDNNIVVPIFHGGKTPKDKLDEIINVELSRETRFKSDVAVEYYLLTDEEKKIVPFIIGGLSFDDNSSKHGRGFYVEDIISGAKSINLGQPSVVLCRFKDLDELKSNFGEFDRAALLKNKIAVGRAGSVGALAKYFDEREASTFHVRNSHYTETDDEAIRAGTRHPVIMNFLEGYTRGNYNWSTSGRLVLMAPWSQKYFATGRNRTEK